MSFHGACHLGFGTFMGLRRATMARLWFALSAPSCAAALYATKLVDTTGACFLDSSWIC